jgi:hypothetical protein
MPVYAMLSVAFQQRAALGKSRRVLSCAGNWRLLCSAIVLRIVKMKMAMLVIVWVCTMIAAIAIGRIYSGVKTYDCSMSEFHPDYTSAIRKACREKRSVKL